MAAEIPYGQTVERTVGLHITMTKGPIKALTRTALIISITL
jgi:hypothetical protein